ncbi:enoyl-CoA hydratase/isomerase family protein [Corynebacterium sp. zg254]|uniref:Enoyl-CoA hydratase/isomerase family protein n=1 Tax=Corynebacterium zhongnanshanii TaxID=2768834 RepID=A0ABQ6VFF4_9CORY|nr:MULTISPECIES: enoyl-CoA hydratase-related protein [Corynebacterium]KAB3523120.1 enoyl-CoA hydratase/isomerase family protein [Corynebacterium zhongnanshanii]MCR5913777.1 enoyl-CoA hydratase/isomerase family protein [Corynebacterium sp. zg254]
MIEQTSDNATPSLVQIEDAHGVRTITINRPDAFNSLNKELRLALISAFRTAATDAAEAGSSVRAVVLRAAGRAFCSGQDLKEQLQDTKNKTGLEKVVEEYNPMIEALLDIPVPTIAAVQGPAAGAGWGIAMAADFRIMSSAASFKGAFTGVGLAADSGLSQSLVDTVGRARALQILLLDQKIGAEEALSLQLVQQVVDPEVLDDTVAAFAAGLASGPTASYKEMKALVKRASKINAAAAAEAEAQERLFHSEDHAEAVTAFVEKRKPNFAGK